MKMKLIIFYIFALPIHWIYSKDLDIIQAVVSLDNTLTQLKAKIPSVITDILSPQEQLEYNFLMRECSKIAEHFTAMGAQRSSGFHNAIFYYLKNRGTRAAFKVLQAQVQAGRLPESYLKRF